MKTIQKTFLAIIAAAALAPMSARASALSAYWGSMDTELFGKGDLVGGSLEFSPVPFMSIQLRGGYADGFDEFNIKTPPIAGMSSEEARISNLVFSQLDKASRMELKDFSIVPLEIGLIGRISMLGFFGVYGGGGYGYYVVPAFEVSNGSNSDYRKSLDDISGYWGLVGVEAGLPNLKLFAEAKFSKIKADDVEIELEYAGYKGNIVADIDLSGVTYLVGVRLQW
jgi:hypothetical protein